MQVDGTVAPPCAAVRARAVAGFYAVLSQGQLGDEREWGLGVALDTDGYGMGGIGGSFGWWSEEGRYAVAFLTGHIGAHDLGERLENAVREALGLPAF